MGRIDYFKRERNVAPATTPQTRELPRSVIEALEQYELWDRRIEEARVHNANPMRKAIPVPYDQRYAAGRLLARLLRAHIG